MQLKQTAGWILSEGVFCLKGTKQQVERRMDHGVSTEAGCLNLEHTAEVNFEEGPSHLELELLTPATILRTLKGKPLWHFHPFSAAMACAAQCRWMGPAVALGCLGPTATQLVFQILVAKLYRVGDLCVD